MPYDVVCFQQFMEFILIYCDFLPWKQGVYKHGIDGFGIFITFSLKSELLLGLIPRFIWLRPYEVDFYFFSIGVFQLL